MKICPPLLKTGDEIRVISPSRSLAIIAPEARALAIERLASMGLKVSFGRHAEEIDPFLSSSIHSRLEDFHEAFSDSNVKGILTTIGGFNSIQLLPHLDWALLKKHPKIFCGFSDITALQNAIFAKTGLVTFSGPHFSTFGCLKGIDPIIAWFKKMVFQKEPVRLEPAASWSDDAWYLDQENRRFEKNEGCWALQPGEAKGMILGGNLGTLNLLQGTDFFPKLDDAILFLEDDELSSPPIFDRFLTSLSFQKGFSKVRGVVIGRFQKASKMNRDLLSRIIASNPALRKVPVIANVDFGHTMPMCTFPIGGTCEMEADSDRLSCKIYF